MRFVVSLSILFVLATPAAVHGECAPDEMMRIMVVDASPGIEPGSAAAFPKTIYRLGATRGRIEQAPDRANGVEGIRIVNAPDSWVVDPIDMTGTYTYDPADDLRFHAPVLAWSGIPGYPRDFELGCELEWLQGRTGVEKKQVDVGGRAMVNYQLDHGAYRINFTVDGPTGLPVAVGVFRDGELVHYLEYLQYRTLTPAEPRLFLPPPGVAIRVLPHP